MWIQHLRASAALMRMIGQWARTVGHLVPHVRLCCSSPSCSHYDSALPGLMTCLLWLPAIYSSDQQLYWWQMNVPFAYCAYSADGCVLLNLQTWDSCQRQSSRRTYWQKAATASQRLHDCSLVVACSNLSSIWTCKLLTIIIQMTQLAQ